MDIERTMEKEKGHKMKDIEYGTDIGPRMDIKRTMKETEEGHEKEHIINERTLGRGWTLNG